MENQIDISNSLIETSTASTTSRNDTDIRGNVEGDQNRMPCGDAALIDNAIEFDRHMEDISCNIPRVDAYTSLLLSSSVCSSSTAQVIRNAIGLFLACLAITTNRPTLDLHDIEEITYHMSGLYVSRRMERYHSSHRATSEPNESTMGPVYITLLQELQDSVCQLGRFHLDRPSAKRNVQQLTVYFEGKVRSLNSFLDTSGQGLGGSATTELHCFPEDVASTNYVTNVGDNSVVAKSQCEPPSYRFQTWPTHWCHDTQILDHD